MSTPILNNSSGNIEDKANSAGSLLGESRKSSNTKSQAFRDAEANILRINEGIILNNMIVTDQLFDALVEMKVMMPSLADEYKNKKDNSDIAKEILDYMIMQVSAGVVGISAICYVFQGSGHNFLADHLRADVSRAGQDTIIDSEQIAKFFHQLPSLIPKDGRDKVLGYLTDKIKEYIARYNWTEDRVRERAEQLDTRWASLEESQKQRQQINDNESKIRNLYSQIDEAVNIVDYKSEILSESAKYLQEMKELHDSQIKIHMSHNAANDSHLNRLELRQRAQDVIAFQIQHKVNTFMQEMKIRTERTSDESLTKRERRQKLLTNHDKALFCFDELFEHVRELDQKREDYEQLVEDANFVLKQLGKSYSTSGVAEMGIQKYIYEVEETLYKRSMENRRLERHIEMCEDEISELKKSLESCQAIKGSITKMKKELIARDNTIKELTAKIFQLRQTKSPKGGKRGTITNLQTLSGAPPIEKHEGAPGIVVTQVAEDSLNTGRRVTYYSVDETQAKHRKSIAGQRKSATLSKAVMDTLKADGQVNKLEEHDRSSILLTAERKSIVKFANAAKHETQRIESAIVKPKHGKEARKSLTIPNDRKEVAEKGLEEQEWDARQQAFVEYVSEAFSPLVGDKLVELLTAQPREADGTIGDATRENLLDYITKTSSFLEKEVLATFLDSDKLSSILNGLNGETMKKKSFLTSEARTKILSLLGEGRLGEGTKNALIEAVAGSMALLDDHLVFELLENVKNEAVVGHKTKSKFMQFLSDSSLRKIEREKELLEREDTKMHKDRRASKYSTDVPEGHLRDRAKSIKLHAERQQMLATANMTLPEKVKYLHEEQKKPEEDQIDENARYASYLSPTSASSRSVSPSSIGSFEETFGSSKTSDTSTQWESYLSIESLDAATQYKLSDVDSEASSDDEDNWIQLDEQVELSATHNLLLNVNPKGRPNDIGSQYLLKINAFALAKLLNARDTRARLSKNVIEFALSIFNALNDFALSGAADDIERRSSLGSYAPSKLPMVYITEDKLRALYKYLNKKTLRQLFSMNQIYSPPAADSDSRRNTPIAWPTIADSFRPETPSRNVREELIGKYRYAVNLNNPQRSAHGKTLVAEEMVSFGHPFTGRRTTYERSKSAFPRLTTLSKRSNPQLPFPERHSMKLMRRPRPPIPGAVYQCWS